MRITWFPEPTKDDPTPGHRGESTLSFLGRSTWELAKACRSFLNEQLNYFPNEIQHDLYRRMCGTWESTFFELLVARSLQLLGADLEFHLPLSTGKKPDFACTFPDSKVFVEARAPLYATHPGDQMKWQSDLLDIIEKYVPKGWWIHVHRLPQIGPSQSKEPFVKLIKEVMAANAASPLDFFDVNTLTADGTLELSFLRANSNGGLGMYPGFSFTGDGEREIRKAFKRKREKLKGSDLPVVLALQRSGWAFDYEAFDCALFGSSVYDLDSHISSERNGGAFALHRDGPPTIDAVLLFDAWNWVQFHDPVLYINPRSQKTLPASIRRLPQRMLSEDKRSVHASIPNRNLLESMLKPPGA